MNIWDVIIIIAIGLALFFAIRQLRKKGRPCCGSCGACGDNVCKCKDTRTK